jgi:hypothetical protein
MVIYRKGEFIILKVSEGFIVYNTKKEWENGHSHLKSLKAAKTAINLVQKGKLPRSRGFYYLTTLQRISTEEKYIERIEQLKQTRKEKGRKQTYYNVNKGVARKTTL